MVLNANKILIRKGVMPVKRKILCLAVILSVAVFGAANIYAETVEENLSADNIQTSEDAEAVGYKVSLMD